MKRTLLIHAAGFPELNRMDRYLSNRPNKNQDYEHD